METQDLELKIGDFVYLSTDKSIRGIVTDELGFLLYVNGKLSTHPKYKWIKLPEINWITPKQSKN